MNDSFADESMDSEQASDRFVELREVLEKVFKAATTSGVQLLGARLSVDVVDGLLSRCKDEIRKMETALKQESGRKRMRGPSPSLNPELTLNGLASCTVALRNTMDANQRYV